MALDYATPGVLTSLEGVPARMLDGLPSEPLAICEPIHALVVHPAEDLARDLPADRLAEQGVRPAALPVRRLDELAPSPLRQGREPGDRVVGTCRHFAVLACALLRHRGVASRARCGFATYFRPGLAVDHWVVELRADPAEAWTRVDVEVIGGTVLATPARLEPGQFLTGGEAWQAYRRGEVDASTFGVDGTGNWGPSEIRGNLVRDLAALNKVETLPWDEWGRMTEAYEGRTGPDYDELLDRVAAATVADDAPAIAELYRHEHLRVPDALIA